MAAADSRMRLVVFMGHISAELVVASRSGAVAGTRIRFYLWLLLLMSV
jgi:hypothetical protein